jgi:hypothetical protein
MKGILIGCVAAASAAVFVGSASAAVIAADGFETYTAGTQLQGGTGGGGFVGQWVVDPADTAGVTVVAQQLDYNAGSLNIDGGNNALRVAGVADSNNLAVRQFPAQSTGPLYFSFLLRTDTASLTNEDFIQVGLSDVPTNEPKISVGSGDNTAPNDSPTFFARVPTGAANSDASTTAPQADVTYLVVGKASKTGGSNTFNRIDLFLNPTSDVEPGTPDADFTFAANGTGTVGSLQYFNIRTARTDSGDQYLFDNVTIATSFADAVSGVVPEPSTAALVGLAAAGLLARRRRNA